MAKFEASSRFSLRNAAIMANLSGRVYDLDASCEKPGIKWIENPQTDTQAVVIRQEHELLVGIRGTEPDKIRDILTDAECMLTEDMYGYRFHAGFYRAYQSIEGQLLEAVNTLRDNHQSLWITGHSMGAGLATILCDRVSRYVPVGGLYTFGSPRVGDFAFHHSFNARFHRAWRVVNNNDVVSRVAPQFMGYSHVGRLYYIDSYGDVRDGFDLTWWVGFWDRLRGRYTAIGDLKPDGIVDHGRERYAALCRDAYRAEVKAATRRGAARSGAMELTREFFQHVDADELRAALMSDEWRR